jgi:tetratricopeptide (TPR) repeat protein
VVAVLAYLGAVLFVGLLAWWLFKARQPTMNWPEQPLATPIGPPFTTETFSSPALDARTIQFYERELARQVSARPFRLLVMTYYTAQAYQDALAASQRFRQVLPTSFAATDLLLHAHLHVYVGEYQQAVEVYTHLLDLNTPAAPIYTGRGYVYTLMAENLLAIQDCSRAIALEPKAAYAYNNRGLALHRLGMSDEGRADIMRSIRLDGHNAHAYRNLGIYYFDQGDYQAALSSFEQAHRLGTNPPDLTYYLKQTRQQLGLG